tara:strand:+ start:1417 stop:2007 length:591 start_codon:yes stop_codon:yes gene_type:complete
VWKKYAAEFFGTFLMVFCGTGSIALGWNSLSVSIAFGASVFLAILIFQPISGAHINPAVSIAFAVNGDLEKRALPGYISAQIFGGLIAALITTSGATIPNEEFHSSFLIEIIITLLLMYSIHVLVRKNANLPTLALGVGLTVGILAYFFGSFTGASMNPARSIGPNIVTESGNLILYIFAPIIGAVLSNFIPKNKN